MCSYILHDAGKDSSDRVLWVDTANIVSDPEHAWFEMFATARDQALLKQQAGQDARGRKNTTPVLHYTLSWAASDNPSPEHMRETALSSLKALKLDQHQALIAAHGDKEHVHVHIVVNTVHPETGMTAPLKYSKEQLSRWAEAYEREHGIHVEQRIKNNETRDNIKIAKRAVARMRENLAGIEIADHFVPVKHKQTQRGDWFERKEIVDRMKQLRAEVAPLLPGHDAAGLWQRQQEERKILDSNSEAAVDHARSGVFERYRPQWRELYRGHKKELRHLERQATHPFERAVFVFKNRERLSEGKPLTLRQMASLILKPDRLLKRVEAVQEKERRSLARAEKSEKKAVSQRIWQHHKVKFETMRARQWDERAAAGAEREEQLRFIVTFDLAKQSLLTERKQALATSTRMPEPQTAADATEPFNAAVNTRSPAQMARVEAIRKQMEDWRRLNPNRDFGHEL